MIIIQKSFTGSNHRSSYQDLFDNDPDFSTNEVKSPNVNELLTPKESPKGISANVVEPTYPTVEQLSKKMEVPFPTSLIPTPKKSSITPVKSEENKGESTPQIMSEESTKEGLSNGAKAGLITAGVAAAGAAGYGAYKALKNRRARKLEVEKSLENKYKTSK